MNLKHWQGYGHVQATAERKTANELTIRVKGLHEYGLDCNDGYTAKRWLFDRFMPKFKDIKYWVMDCLCYEERFDEAVYTFRPKFGMTFQEALKS